MTFWSMVGQAIRQTAREMGPSTIDRSNFLGLAATWDTESPVYYADFRPGDYRAAAGRGAPSSGLRPGSDTK
jgi:hypothetical protein